MSTPGCTVKISNGGKITTDDGDTATFGGNAKASASGSTSGEETYQDHGPARPLTVKSITVVAVICGQPNNGATILGNATVDGSGVHEFEIDVTDQGEPGTLDTYRILIPDIPYDSGTQTLEGGNIQVSQ